MVYADVEFSLEFVHINEMVTNIRLTSGDPACSYLIATGIICTVNLPRGVYNISINQTNQLGSTVATDVLDGMIFINPCTAMILVLCVVCNILFPFITQLYLAYFITKLTITQPISNL